MRPLLDALEDALVERGLALAFRICGLWQRERYKGDVVGVEPRVDVLQSEEAVREESRRDEENERQCNLRNDQHGSRPGASPSGGGGPIRIAQRAYAVGSRRLQCGNQAEEHGGRERRRNGDDRNPQVQTICCYARNALGITFNNSVSAQLPDKEAARAAGGAEYEAFGDQLTHQARPRAPSAARIASSRWRPAARASSRLATFAQAISSTRPTAPSSSSNAARTSPTIRREGAGSQSRGRCCSRRIGSPVARQWPRDPPPLFGVDPWKQPADRLEVMHAAACEQVAGNVDGRHRHRFAREHPGLRLFGVASARRHHADDRVRNAVDAYPGAHDGAGPPRTGASTRRR